MIRELHSAKIPALFLKLDIAKVFDSVRWDYMMEVLQQFGFGSRWRNWVSILCSTATISILLNGTSGRWFMHHRGLRAGWPSAPDVFHFSNGTPAEAAKPSNSTGCPHSNSAQGCQFENKSFCWWCCNLCQPYQVRDYNCPRDPHGVWYGIRFESKSSKERCMPNTVWDHWCGKCDAMVPVPHKLFSLHLLGTAPSPHKTVWRCSLW